MEDEKIYCNPEEILDKLDDLIRDKDIHHWSYQSYVHGGLTFAELVKIARMVREFVHTDNQYYFEYGFEDIE